MRKLRPDEIQDRRRATRFRTHPVMAVLENVRSLHNVGSMFRTADAAGLADLALVGITATPEHHGLRKTALGAEETVPWTYFETPARALESAREGGYRIAVLEITDRPRPVEVLSASDFPLCLVVGNEVSGVSEEAVSAADFAIEIPQYGHKHSLNAAVAFGVAIFDLIGRWNELAVDADATHRPESGL
ncbi:MAG: TrmH family RNA methyltransferase, partial [Rhodothermales bacterium]|nr:TrmH family RNA methyltransferase [Rhodothermales bacterium]